MLPQSTTVSPSPPEPLGCLSGTIVFAVKIQCKHCEENLCSEIQVILFPFTAKRKAFTFGRLLAAASVLSEEQALKREA